MTTSSGRRPGHLPSSPFQPKAEPTIELYDMDDMVSHDAYGMGRVVGVEAHAVTVDFRNQTVRVKSPYSKMSKL